MFSTFQDDIVMGTLTVRENLMFSANLRLPDSLLRKEKRHKVEEIIQELGLTSCANTKVCNIPQSQAYCSVNLCEILDNSQSSRLHFELVVKAHNP